MLPEPQRAGGRGPGLGGRDVAEQAAGAAVLLQQLHRIRQQKAAAKREVLTLEQQESRAMYNLGVRRRTLLATAAGTAAWAKLKVVVPCVEWVFSWAPATYAKHRPDACANGDPAANF